MINTLLEHVPIKMEVQEIDETNSIPVNPSQDGGVAKDDAIIDETDDDVDADDSDVDEELDIDEEDDEEDDEESDIETDALEIEKEATMLISSDEEAELEAQRIRFPDITITKKLRRGSNISSVSSRSSFTSQPHITYEIVKRKDSTTEETNNKQRISPCLKHMGNKSLESCNKENNKKILLKQKAENKNLENNKSLDISKTKPEESTKRVDNINTTTENHKHSENTRRKENLLKSPANVTEQKSRRGSSNSICSVASTVASDSAETESCGNIYVFNLEQKLIFNCEFCDLKYSDLDNFGLHLHETHNIFNFDEDPEKENAPRNLSKSSRKQTCAPKNSVNVKKEPLQNVELKAEPPVVLPPSALAEPLDSCGNVFMLNHRKLFLVCGYCECKYANLELFEKHLMQQHRIFEGCHNELNVLPKLEVKEEAIAVDKPDIIIPQAMVAIPADIPLDRSITPENETITALKDVIVVAESAVPKDIVREETAVFVKETNASEKNSPVDKMDKKSVQYCAEVDKQQNSLDINAAELSVDMTKQSSNEANINAAVTEHENSINEKKEKSVVRKTRYKRQSLPDKQLESNYKRSKRNTTNDDFIKQESLALNKTDKHSAKTVKAEPLVEKENCAGLAKTKEKQSNNKCRKSPDPLKIAANELRKQEKTTKSAKCIETEKATSSKKTPTRESNKTPELEQKTNKIREKLPDTDKRLLNLAEATETKKIPEPEKNTSKKLAKTKETKKTTAVEKVAANKLTETKKAKKLPDPDKTTTVKLEETTEVGKIDEAEQIATLILAENKVTRKTIEPEKPTTSKLVYGEKTTALNITETKKKITSLKNTEIKESSTTVTKRAATEQPVFVTVQPQNPTTSNAAINNLALPPEIKILPDTEEFETENGRLKCSMCPKKFRKKRGLILHERYTHQTGTRKTYGCGICGKDFWSENERKIHMLGRHNADTLFECDICYRAFSSKNGLSHHNAKVHATRLFKCGECLRTYSSESSLKTHLYVYHNACKKVDKRKYTKRNTALPTTILQEHSVTNEAVQDADAQLDNKIKNDINAETVGEIVGGLQNVVEQLPMENSIVIYATDDINLKPIDIIDKQLTNVELANLTETADNYCIKPKSNNTAIPNNAQHDMVLEISSQSTDLKALPAAETGTRKTSRESTTLAFGVRDEEDDANADPVNDIIAQLQNELVEGSTKTTNSATNNVVTYTINAMPNKEETQKSVFIDADLNVVEKIEDVTPTFMKIVKHFVCDICSKTYYKHSRLIEHKRLHTGEKPFDCDQCGKKFRVRNRLNEHKQRHVKEKKFKCEVCQLPLCTRQDYNQHMRHHENDRRHRCSVCTKAFVRSSDLKIHERIHTGEKPFECDICHKCFRANQNLSVHKKSHMGDISKTFKCDYCEKKFMRKIDRKVHMRTHTGEKPYKCEICQRGYSSRVNVRAHIDRDHIKGGQEEKKKPVPKPRSLREELERQKKLIEELQNQLLQQIKTDEKIVLSDDEMQAEHILPDSPVIVSVSAAPSSNKMQKKTDPVQKAYKLLSKLKSSSSSSSTKTKTITTTTSTTTSKSLTLIPSPPPLDEPPSSPPLIKNAKQDSTTTILPLTITQKLEQPSSSSASSSSSAVASTSSLVTRSPPSPSLAPSTAATATATKVVSQKTSLGIQQVSVTVSMQVENVTSNSNNSENENSNILTTSPSGASSVKKERKITSYFSVLDQKSKV